MYIIYKSKQNTQFVFLSIYFIIFFLLIYLMIKNGFSFWIGILLFFDLFLFLNFYKLTFLVTSEGIEFGFGFFRRKIKKENISSVFIDSSLGNFVSTGIIFKSGVWGFLAKSGDGLKIKLKNNAVFFVTQENPAEILELMKKQKYV